MLDLGAFGGVLMTGGRAWATALYSDVVIVLDLRRERGWYLVMMQSFSSFSSSSPMAMSSPGAVLVSSSLGQPVDIRRREPK